MVLNKNHDIFPVNSISSSVLVSCNESGEWVYINSDNYGFRNSKETYDRDIDSIFIEIHIHGEHVLKIMKQYL